MARQVIELDGRTLSCGQVRDIARGGVAAKVSAAGRERAGAAARTVADVVTRRPVHGRSTGVGSNRDQAVLARDAGEHGFRLLRSHAALAA